MEIKILELFFINVSALYEKEGLISLKLKFLILDVERVGLHVFFSDLAESPQNIFGVDLSKNRIARAIEMNPKINYTVGDVLFPPHFSTNFDIVTAIDIFMHLKSKEDILLGLNNIKNLLNNNGYFIWYDAFASDHFKVSEGQDHAGFHPKQMIALAKEAGFTPVFKINVFKRIFWKYHSLYLIKRLPVWLVSVLEKILPGSPGNMVIIFEKSK